MARAPEVPAIEVFVVPRLVVHWWALVIRGVAAILFGLLAVVWPSITITALVLLYGAYVLVDGAFALVAAVSRAKEHRRWGPLALEGIVSVAAGLIALVWPGITAVALLIVIGIWAIVTGVIKVRAAIEIRREVEGEWIIALAGATSILFGAMLLIVPRAGAIALVTLIAFFAMFFGVLLVMLGLRLRPLEQAIKGSQATAA
jgi:uncharacterized membrane protein HdeD (DUF308 family)